MVLFYDITTAAQLAALNHIIIQIDIKLGYLAADGVTSTPKIGVSAWQEAGIGCPAPLGVGETTHWTMLHSHPTQSGRYALHVDDWVAVMVTWEINRLTALASPTIVQTQILNALTNLPIPVVLDSSWKSK